MGDGNEPTGAEHGSTERRRNPDEGYYAPTPVVSVYCEVERFEGDVHLNIRDTKTGRRVSYVSLNVIAAERVAREMIEVVRQIERILEAQAGAS